MHGRNFSIDGHQPLYQQSPNSIAAETQFGYKAYNTVGKGTRPQSSMSTIKST